MVEMTDERAAEVLAAHNAWRRYDRLPGEPGAPEMGDPVELGRAIDHVVSRLRSKPPAEAQPVALDYVPGELDRTAPENIWLQIDTSSDNSGRQDPWPGADGVTWQDESVGGLEIQYVRADLVSPPSVPVGVGRKYPDDGTGDDDAYNRGWNDCLDAIAQQPQPWSAQR